MVEPVKKIYYYIPKIRDNLFLLLVLFFFYLHLNSRTASCSEVYRIDNQSTLLYKTINWWYDCLPQDNYFLCGKAIKYSNYGNARIEYTESMSILKISVQRGFADLLSIFKNCDDCLGPSYLRCIWLNEKYFGKSKATPVSHMNQFIFHPMDKSQARIFKKLEKNIIFIVEGNILGLINEGKIALYNTGNLLKSCPNAVDDKGAIFPITVKIMNAKNDEILARYLAIWTK